MKTFSLILRGFCSCLVVLVALAFAFVESTLLATQDFALYQNPFVALIQIALKLAVALLAGALGVLSLIKTKRNFLPHSLCLLASTVVMILFVSNNVALYLAAVAMLFALSQILFATTHKAK